MSEVGKARRKKEGREEKEGGGGAEGEGGCGVHDFDRL